MKSPLQDWATVTQLYTEMLTTSAWTRPRRSSAGSYFATMGNQETRAQTGFANWFQDFPHPANFMFLVSGRSIQPRSNQNLGNIDDPEITAEIERLRLEADLERVARARAVLDRRGRRASPRGVLRAP
jgi:peptide/nickel transport system substrate-binding protein